MANGSPQIIELTVVDADGVAVAGALVTVEYGDVAVPERAIVTNGEGLCRVALPAGRFNLAAFHKGREGRVAVSGEAAATLVLLAPPTRAQRS